MSQNKKYYWLKFKIDFFSDIRLLKLRSIAGGDTYIVIFLKLMLLSIKNEGIVIYEGVFPTLAEELSYCLREDAKNIQIVLDFSISHGMIEENQNQYLIPYASENIGSETAGAERVRKHRAKNNKSLHCNSKETKCNTEIEIDIDIEKHQKLNEILLQKQICKDKQKIRDENLSQQTRDNQIIEI